MINTEIEKVYSTELVCELVHNRLKEEYPDWYVNEYEKKHLSINEFPAHIKERFEYLNDMYVEIVYNHIRIIKINIKQLD